MRISAISVLVFGVYLSGAGATLIGMPNLFLSVLGFPLTDEPWIRVVGILILALALYYIQAARTDLQPFIQWTVYGRIGVFVGFTALVLTGIANPMLLLLGGIDLAAAIWTAWALQRERQHALSGTPSVVK